MSVLGIVDRIPLRICVWVIWESAFCGILLLKGIMFFLRCVLQEFPIVLPPPNQFESYKCFLNFYCIIAINL